MTVNSFEEPYGPLIDTTMRVMTWNIWFRFGPWEQRQPAVIETLRRVDADVIALQEVWADDDVRQIDLLAAELGMHAAYDSRLVLDDFRFGNAVLSRWPISDTATLVYESDDSDESRLALTACGPATTSQSLPSCATRPVLLLLPHPVPGERRRWRRTRRPNRHRNESGRTAVDSARSVRRGCSGG